MVFSKEPELGDYQLGAAWGMSSSIFYAIYLVMLRRKVDNEDKLDIPMFFGKWDDRLPFGWSTDLSLL